ncbi:AlpA family transcriptional regulator [Deefgea sp. CFH1-16]|uniref:helix-turn-helix transcriptional regulator n=1 Tax=Deefgea sp. CFH1-16 TaxID=2675457 RepID=UPI0015F73B8B|nr:AlpA family phage regulatory protein [Deefgea sp. CFH1-16]MBM5575594.1 AlpA family phage regulatory protein [Deefgea sp. CFH1-16]
MSDSNAPRLERFISRTALKHLIGDIADSTLYEWQAKNLFPKPVPLGAQRVGWLESEIIAWQQSKIAERNAN